MIPAGYTVKFVHEKDDWLKASNIKNIYSVSECISKCPINHYDHWKFNSLVFYDNEKILEELLVKDVINKSELTWFYYEIFEKEILNGIWKEFEVEKLNVEKLDSYKLVGFDIACYSIGSSHDCSPLSCNRGAEVFEVNEFCLINKLEDAINSAEKIDKDGGYEPGPYRILGVYKKEF